MDAALLPANEPTRWTIVFHRQAENRFFSALAMGRFKHVSAYTWCPAARVWLHFDVGFRRTRIIPMPDTPATRAYLIDVVRGNALVSMRVRHDAQPLFRLGLFCTSAVKHLIGLPGSALRPDALFASCLRHGGELSDDAGQNHSTGGRPESCARTAAGGG